MKYNHSSLLAASFAWMSFASTLLADPPASIEIVGVKLIDKNKISVEFEVKNTSDKNINIDSDEHANIWVRTATLDGKYYYDNPLSFNMIWDSNYKPVITLYYANTSIIHGNYLNYGNFHPSPLVLKPGEKKAIPILIDIQWLLQDNDFMTTLSKDIWVRVALDKSGGEPTKDEDQELMKQSHLLTREEYTQAQNKFLRKYPPIEIARSHLYKLKIPEAGKDDMVLKPLKDDLLPPTH